MDDSWAFAFALAGAVGNIATALALYFVYRQSRTTQEQTLLTSQEMKSTLRPWIAVSKIQANPHNRVVFDIKNYGRVPAKIMRMRTGASRETIEEEELRSHETQDFKMMVFPDATTHYILDISGVLPYSEYLGVLFEYEYGDNKKRGDYGVIAKRGAVANTYDYNEVFAN